MKNRGVLLLAGILLLAGATLARAQMAGWTVQSSTGSTPAPGDTVTLAQAQAGQCTALGPPVPVTPGADLALSFRYTGENLAARDPYAPSYAELTVTVTWIDPAGKDVDERLLALGFPPVKRVWVLAKSSATPVQIADNLIAPDRAATARVSFTLTQAVAIGTGQAAAVVHPVQVQISAVTLAPGQVAPQGLDLPDTGPADAGPLSTRPAGFKFGPNLVANGALEDGDALPSGWHILGDNSAGAAVWKQGGAYSGKRCFELFDRAPYIKSWENKTDVFVPDFGAPHDSRVFAREEVSARFASEPVPAQPGTLYQATAMVWFLKRPGSELTSISPVRIQFLDAQGKVLPYHGVYDDWTADTKPYDLPGWVLLVTRPVIAPGGAVSVRLVVALNHALYGPENHQLRTYPEGREGVLVDNIALYRVPTAVTPDMLKHDFQQYTYDLFADTIKAGAMPYVPTSPAHRPNSLSVESLTDYPGGLLIGTPPTLTAKPLSLHVQNRIGDQRPLEIRYDLVDWQEKTVFSGSVKTTLDPFADTTVPLKRPPALPYGPYTVRYTVLDSGRESDRGESRFAVIRPNSNSYDEKGRMDYPFGTWATNMDVFPRNEQMDQAKELGLFLQAMGQGKDNWICEFYLSALMDPNPATRKAAVDACIVTARRVYSTLIQYGIHPIGLIQPPNVVPVAQYPVLTEVTTQIVNGCKDLVHFWTYGDEQLSGAPPDLDTEKNPDGSDVLNWGREGSLRQFLTEYVTCYRAAKAADPTCTFGPDSACDPSGNALKFLLQAFPDKPFDWYGSNMFTSTFTLWPPNIAQLKKVGLENLPLFGNNFGAYAEAPATGAERYQKEAEATRHMTTYWVETLQAFPTLCFIPQWGGDFADDQGSLSYLHRARPQYVAYANMTDCLGAGKFTAKYELPGALVFVRERAVRPGLVGVMWSTGAEAVAELQVGVPAVEISDVWGNRRTVPTQAGVLQVALTPMPQYLLGAKTLTPAPSVKITLANVTSDPHNPLVAVTIANGRATPVEGTLALVPESALAVAPASQTVAALPAGASRTFTFQAAPVDPDGDQPLALRARFVTPQRTYEALDTVNFNCALQVTTPPALDGDLTNWTQDCPFVVNRSDQFWSYQSRQPWGGPDDLSGKLWMRWDATNLYLAARVHSQAYSPASDLGNTWNSDAIEMGFDLSGRLQKGGTLAQIALGVTPDGQAHVYRYGYDPALPPGEMTAARIVVKRQGHETVYATAIPWKEIVSTFTPHAGATISVAFGFNDDNAGLRIMSWFHKVSGLEASAFGRVRLLGSPAASPVPGLAPPQNLLPNGDFEDPTLPPGPKLEGWLVWAQKNDQGQPSGIAYLTTEGAYQGRSLCLERNTKQAALQVAAWHVPVKPGEVYLLRAMVRAPEAPATDQQIRLLLDHEMPWFKALTPASHASASYIGLAPGELPDSNAWAPLAGVFEVGPDRTTATISFDYNWSSGKGWFDNVGLYRLR
jgi:hypothetical protein